MSPFELGGKLSRGTRSSKAKDSEVFLNRVSLADELDGLDTSRSVQLDDGNIVAEQTITFPLIVHEDLLCHPFLRSIRLLMTEERGGRQTWMGSSILRPPIKMMGFSAAFDLMRRSTHPAEVSTASSAITIPPQLWLPSISLQTNSHTRLEADVEEAHRIEHT